MQKIMLDVVNGTELVGTADTELGPITLELVEEHGPAGGNPILGLTGEPGALLVWLLREYTSGNLADALYFLTESTK
jgi:hypothetical protein